MVKKSEKLSVAFCFDDSLDSSDGVAQQVKILGGWLGDQGHEVCYLVGETKLTDWRGAKIYSLAKNLGVRFNHNRLSTPLPANTRRIKEILKTKNFDVLHVTMPYSPLMSQRVINRIPKQTFVVGTFHIFPSGPLAKTGSYLLRLWYGRSLRRFNRVISVSPAAQDYAKTYFGIDTQVIPNAVDVDKFKVKKIEVESRRAKTIVFLGRLVKRKGCSELIDAFYELTISLPDVKLTIAGDGPQRKQLENKCRKLGIAHQVTFLGFIAEDEKPSLLASADIACFPSLYGESFGVVLIEAMAAGAGVVLGGDNPGYRSVLGQQPLLLVSPGNTREFSQRLKLLLEDRLEVQRLHQWQSEAVKQYDISIVGKQILNLYTAQIAPEAKKSHNGAHGL